MIEFGLVEKSLVDQNGRLVPLESDVLLATIAELAQWAIHVCKHAGSLGVEYGNYIE